MMQRPWHAMVLVMLMGGWMMSCTSSSGEPDDSGTPGEESNLEEDAPPCVDDGDCESYYRCIADTCQVPPAISGESDESTPRAIFEVEGEELAQFYLELAISDDEQQQGLMYRPEMRDDWGMLFVYEQERHLSFWMKNTLIPLDMIFVDAEGQVVGVVHEAEPETTSPRTVGRAAQYVLEINGGLSRELGIERGVTMGLENVEEMVQ